MTFGYLFKHHSIFRSALKHHKTVTEYFSDPPEVEVLESRREYHPKLKQRQLSVGCNVSADPSPDVNWMRGRLVLSTHDTKVTMISISMGISIE